MTSKKFRRKRRKYRELINLEKNLIARINIPISKKGLKNIIHSFYLSNSDRINYIYKTDSQNNIREITSVSYNLLAGNDWITIVYYDNCHAGVLHRHTRISIENTRDVVDTIGIKKSSDPNKQLTWANKDLRNRYAYYRRNFIKRNYSLLKKEKIELY